MSESKFEKNRKWWVLGTVCFALFMIILDGNVVNLAIPSIIKSFNASMSQIEWVTNAYLLTFAVFLITFGRLGDEFGRKKLFMVGLSLFTLGSVLCGIAGSVEQLIAFRVIQGLGGAAMMPATLSLITVNFKKEERGVALGVWGAMAGLGVVFGPIIGGYLTQGGLGETLNSMLAVTENWRYVFFINLPVGILALFLAWFIIPESKDKEKKHKIDFMGILLSGASIFFLTFAFIEGTKYGWWKAEKTFSLWGKSLNLGEYSFIPFCFLLSAAFIVLFFLWERKEDKEPLINLELFRDRNYAVGNLVTMILAFAMMGSFFLLPLFLQSILGYEPAETGRILLPLALPMIVTAPLAGKLADRFGAKYLAFFGLLTMALGQFLIARFTVDTSVNDLILPFVIMGAGMGLVQAPISSAVLKNVPEDKAGGASGVVTTIRQVGSVMGIAVLGAVLQSYLVTNIDTNLSKIEGLPSAAKEQIVAEAKSGNTVRSDAETQSTLEKTLKEQIQKSYPAQDLSKLSPEKKKTVLEQIQRATQTIIQKFEKVGAAIGDAIKISFVDSINSTIQVASYITVFGAFVSLFIVNPKTKKKGAKE